jgi:tetratricopeptide (TPR) repeat protein
LTGFARSSEVIAFDKPPYPGLRPFERNESHLFFGRDGCIDQMVARLAEQRFLAVLGSSGTGKSSLVKTGLFSALEMGLLPGAGSRWLIVDMRPGGNPLGHLARELVQAEAGATRKLPPTDAVAILETRFKREGPLALITWWREGHFIDQTNLLILVDQFEELLRYQDDDGREDAQAFVSLLLESRWPRGAESPRDAALPIYVAMTMRSEYVGACALIEGLAEAVNEGTYLTPRMKRRELEEAIVGPARVSGSDIEPRLVTRILNDLADFAPWDEGESKDQLSRLARRADQLPLMQHALNRIWQRARQRRRDGEELTLALADYRGLERELDEHAEQVYGRLEDSVKPTAECVFRAVTSGTTVADAVRRPTRYGDLVEICGAGNRETVARVVDAFGPRGCQFLTSDVPQTGERLPGEALIDITHESLIRQWKRLSDWVENEGRAANEWLRLRESVKRKGLLHGPDLSIAADLRGSEPTTAWSQRYGGDFDKVTQLIKRSERWHKFKRIAMAIAPVLVLGIGALLYLISQQTNFANRNFELAISSAQTVVDQVKTSLEQGVLTVKGAQAMLEAAKKIIDRARKIDATVETTELLIRLQHSFFDVYGTLGNYEIAYENAKRAKELAESLQATHPDNPKVRQLIYDSILRIGDARAHQGKWDEARKEYQEAQELARKLALQTSEDGSRQRELMLNKMGDLQQALGQYAEAMVTYRSALDVIEKATAGGTQDRSWRRDLAAVRRGIGEVLIFQERLKEALEQFSAAIEIDEKLAKEDPADTVTQSNLAYDHQHFGRVYERLKRWADAEAAYRRAIAIQEPLAATDHDNATWQYSLALFRMALGDALKGQSSDALNGQRKLDDALEQYRQAYGIRKELARKDTNNADRQVRLAKSGIAIASVLVTQKQRLEDAAKFCQEAIGIYDEALPRHDDEVFDCYVKIGDIRRSQQDLNNALTEYKRAWSIANDKVADDQNDAKWQERLMDSSIMVGDVLAEEKNVPEALENYQRALQILTSLAEKNPQNTRWPELSETVKSKMQRLRA